MACTVEIVSIGNELLIGKIANTNAQWLAKRITTLAGDIRRIIDIGDDLHEISSIVREAAARKPTFVIVTGGLGPTFDDMTLEGLSLAFNAPLRLDPGAEKLVRSRYRMYEAETGRRIEMTPERLKMAVLPEGGRPLRNPAGTAPGVMLQQGFTTIIALPGVPKEMQAIFEESVEPIVRRAVGSMHFHTRSLESTDIIESELAPLIETTMEKNPKVYIKSHPKAPEPKPLMELHFSTTSEKRETARRDVDKASNMLTQLILKCGGSVRDIPSEE